MKIITFIATIILFFQTGITAADLQNGSIHYAGGMLYHVRYCSVTLPDITARGVASGLGGRVAFYLAPSFRVGGMGFRSECAYDANNGTDGSYVQLSCGGLTGEYVKTVSKVKFTSGVCAGGGKLVNLHILSKQNDITTARFDSYGTMILIPFLSMEYALTGKIAAAAMTDWILGTKMGDGNSFGPALHIGILFGR